MLDLLFSGSAVAQASAYFTMFLLTLLYILISKSYKETWEGTSKLLHEVTICHVGYLYVQFMQLIFPLGWSIEGLYDWGKFARTSFSGMLMLGMEWWAFEIGVFLSGQYNELILFFDNVILSRSIAGTMGITELGAQSVVLNLDAIWFQVCIVQFS